MVWLPVVVVTEFAGAIINLMTFGPWLSDAPHALMLDALVVPSVLASRAGGSRMMQWMHRELLSLPEFARFEHSLYAAQVYGPRNAIVDAGSRGRILEMEQIMRHMGMEPSYVEIPERAYSLLDRAVAYWRSLTPVERGGGKGVSANSEGDGPTRVLTPLERGGGKGVSANSEGDGPSRVPGFVSHTAPGACAAALTQRRACSSGSG